jgi:nitrogen regulatory protein PII
VDAGLVGGDRTDIGVIGNGGGRMSTQALTTMKKIEVVVGTEDAHAVRTLLEHAGVSGFTAISAASGLGHGGYHASNLAFNTEAGLTLLLAVASEARADALVVGLRELLEARSGVFFVSDVAVSRPEYFA